MARRRRWALAGGAAVAAACVAWRGSNRAHELEHRRLAEEGTLDHETEDLIRVVVGMRDGITNPFVDGFDGYQLDYDYKYANAKVVTLPRSELAALQNDSRVAYWEEDFDVYPQQVFQAETVPWGISTIQADTTSIPLADPNGCFKVCIVDSGLLLPHPDIPYFNGDGFIKGQSFGTTAQWDRPVEFARHGTHVAGTMFAKGGNGQGIQGVIYNAQGICPLIARVFDDNGNGAPNSEIDRSIEWCAIEGARVINLSLGNRRYSMTSQSIYRGLEAEGILMVAAAGNGGENIDFYPASYDGVMSVTSVGATLERSGFAIFNNQVDIAAPGESILSTAPRIGLFDSNGNEYDSSLMAFSPLPNQPVTADLVNCGRGTSTCTGATGRICLIERGDASFAVKARSCENGGGVGAIIYYAQNELGPLRGDLGATFVGTIPIMEVAWEDGARLLQQQRATISLQVPSYTVLGGTSMAAPHVAAAATRLWSVRPACTLDQIRWALLNSTIPLDGQGRSIYTGHGLLQVRAAYNYLLSFPEPCGTDSIVNPASSGNQLPPVTDASDVVFIRKVAPLGDKDYQKLSEFDRPRGGTKRRGLKGSKNDTR